MGFSIMFILEFFDVALYSISLATILVDGDTEDEHNITIGDEFLKNEYGTPK